MTPLTKYEKETIINFNAGEDVASVYTRDKSVMRKLDKYVEDFPTAYSLITEDEVSKTYSMPKTYVNYRKPRRLTDEQREQRRLCMNKINNNDNLRKELQS